MRASRGFGPRTVSVTLVERFWKSLPKRVRAPYTKAKLSQWDPEYRETRGTLREDGGTTPPG